MAKVIKEVKEKILPQDGAYHGYWSGYVLSFFDGTHFFETKISEGVRGFHIPCVINVVNGVASKA